MASLVNRQNGTREIQFVDVNGRRQTVRLGKMSKRAAGTVKIRLEELLSAAISKQPIETETARWVASLDDVLTERLAKVGLIRRRESLLLGQFLEDYIEGRTDVKPATRRKYHSTRERLLAYFGEVCNLRDITAGIIDDWRLEMKAEGLAENTIRKHIAVAKVFFTGAVRKRIINSSPLEDQKATIRANPERFYFISHSEADKVLDACPDAQWRLLFALSRYGGLRCPSEHLGLRWSDVDWDRNRIRVWSPKTEHHAGKASRDLPIFPELKPYLEEVWEQAEVGTEYVITRYRDTNANLRTQLCRIIDRAGLERWPKLFQNLRSTRQTELEEMFPSHVVCAWIGNSKAVAQKHYLQVTEDHFHKATQNPTQTVHETGCQSMSWTSAMFTKSLSGRAGHLMSICQVAEAGLEPARGLPLTGF